MATLDIHLFGVARVRHDAVEVDQDLSPAVRSMLGYLVLNRHRTHHRDVLAGDFWCDVDDQKARHRLSTTLWRLRRVLEPDGIAPGTYLVVNRRGSVGFNASSDYWLDVEAFEQAASRLTDHDFGELTAADVDRFHEATTLYQGDLLEGTDLAWLVIERERMSELYSAANARALDWYASMGQFERAIVAGQRVLARDPLREDVHRALIRVYQRFDQPQRAKRQFEACRAILRDELGVSPLPETVVAAAQPAPPADQSDAPTLDVDTALELIETAASALGLAAHELAELSGSLRSLTAP